MIGFCGDCGDAGPVIGCADGLHRCCFCAHASGFCETCGATGAIVDDSASSGLCAACRADAWDAERTERAAWRLWDTGR